ncbi:MAG: hypothetical protein KJ000_19210 [Pirellulaceae bacterium]|nr:hypothetical protein [Pirellulaceae bacterium]
MLPLEHLQPGLSLVGLEPAVVTSLVAVVPIAEGTVQVIYKTPDGALKERLLNQADEASISIATLERPWSVDGDGSAFQLACEAKRIDLAFLFDPIRQLNRYSHESFPSCLYSDDPLLKLLGGRKGGRLDPGCRTIECGGFSHTCKRIAKRPK